VRLLAQYLTKHTWDFHQMYNFGVVWDKDKLIRLWGQ